MKDYKTKVIVLGAGYAGMMAALRLAGKTLKENVDVTLINGINDFIQRPQLVQLMVDRPFLTKPIDQMLRGSRVNFKQGWVTAIDTNRRIATVETKSGILRLNYDSLIYALGSIIDQENVPGIHEYAYVLNPSGSRSVKELSKRLVELSKTGGRVVVIGGGPTGIEVVSEINSQYPGLQTSLVTAGEFGAFRGKLKRHFRQAFLQQGITFFEYRTVTAVEEGKIVTTSGETIQYDLCIWAGGFRASPLARAAGLMVNSLDQILIDPYGRSISHPEIFAAGDASMPVEEPGVPIRMSLFTALTQAALAADNLIAAMHHKTQKPLSFTYYGQGISLGYQDAVGFVSYPDDQPHGPVVRGRLAVWIREFAVRLVLYLLELERRRPGFYFWIANRHYAAVKRAESRQRPTSHLTV